MGLHSLDSRQDGVLQVWCDPSYVAPVQKGLHVLYGAVNNPVMDQRGFPQSYVFLLVVPYPIGSQRQALAQLCRETGGPWSVTWSWDPLPGAVPAPGGTLSFLCRSSVHEQVYALLKARYPSEIIYSYAGYEDGYMRHAVDVPDPGPGGYGEITWWLYEGLGSAAYSSVSFEWRPWQSGMLAQIITGWCA